MYNGVINVYKEPGYTSFDVIAKLRGILKQKKIGHTGTLDPDAEGVLVVCLGNATKLCDVLTDKDKCYTATMRLGITTDTEDSSGKILEEREVDVTEEQVKEVVSSFVGEYHQIPPMYSAIKVNGKKLYELARAGVEVERKPRPVVIHSIDIIEINLPVVRFRVNCGKGTYIRSLCRDIGDRLGCGATMEHLLRDRVNATETGKQFTVENSLTLSQIEDFVSRQLFSEYVLPIDEMFPNYERIRVNRHGEKKLKNGNFIYKNEICKMPEIKDGEKYLVYDEQGIFTAIYVYDAACTCFKVDKMFL